MMLETDSKMMDETDDKYVKQWGYIPDNAFLYLPQGDQIKIESGQKQWRKIFQNQPFDQFENQQLAKLEERLEGILVGKQGKKIQVEKVAVDGWFDQVNKLRYLQANNFKLEETVEAMKETTKWRSTAFPINSNQSVQALLDTGVFYLCGRDKKYRPILIANISKLNSQDIELIPQALTILMEFMIQQLLIEGQVQNYILIMDIEEAGFSTRNIIMKILQFANNHYVGRLFACYLLSTPSLMQWVWEAVASKLVSEDIVRRIKVTGVHYHDEMWTHISKDIVQRQYGGNMDKLRYNFWPPHDTLMQFIDESNQHQNNLITQQKYLQLYYQNKLRNRKINQKFIKKDKEIQPNSQLFKINTNGWSDVFQTSGIINSKADKSKIVIRVERSFIKDYPSIKTFFQTPEFKSVCFIKEVSDAPTVSNAAKTINAPNATK